MKMKEVVAKLFFLAGLEALGAVVFLFLLPADPKNAVLWGYSVSRLVMTGGMLVVGAGCAAAGVIAWRRPELVERGLNWFSENAARLWSGIAAFSLLSVSAWIVVWLPAYRFDGYAAFYERLIPVIIWVGLSCGQTLFAILIWQDVLNARRFWDAVRSEKGVGWFAAGGLILFALIQAAAVRFDFLATHDMQQYNPPGAPILPLQVVIAGLTGLMALVLTGVIRRKKKAIPQNAFWKRADWGIFIVIWAAGAILWIRTPMQPTFFAPLQRPPDGVLFPYSDAALYDRTAQFALLGLGLRNGGYVDKPLYSSFLTVLHLIGGQNFDLITAMQAAVLALLPAFAYALGRQLHSRAAGVVAAAFVIFRGINTIAGGHWIQTAHARLLLSEMPTGLAMAFLVYFLVRWFKNPRMHLYPVLAGGTLGLSTLIRHNPWLLVPVIVLTALIVYWRQWKRWLVQVSLFGLAMLMVIAPWMYYSEKTVGTPWYFMIPLRGVVWKGRLQPEIGGSGYAPEKENGVLASAAKASTMGSILLSHTGGNLLEMKQASTGIGRIVQILSAHLYNNFRGSLLVLPETWVADDLDRALSAPDSVWQGGWTEGVSVWMVANVGLILLGIGASWKKLGISGVVPLTVFGGYLVAVSAARTSGGRYLVPVDWVVLLYYAMGIVQVMMWVAGIQTETVKKAGTIHDERTPRWQWAAGMIGLVLVAGMIPFVQEVLPRSLPESGEEVMPSAAWMTAAGIDPLAVEEFLERDGAVVRSGKAVYPRFYGWKEGEFQECYGVQPYPRLVFELIGEEGTQCVVLPYASLSYEVPLHFSNAVVLGCDDGGDWIVMFPEEDLALVRFTETGVPTCPLRAPICADNRNCR